MAIFKEKINNHICTFDININEETSKTIIKYTANEYDLSYIMKALKDVYALIERHAIFQKPIIEIHIPKYLIGELLDDISAEMPNTIRNSFSKLYIIDACRKFGYDGYYWKLESFSQPAIEMYL